MKTQTTQPGHKAEGRGPRALRPKSKDHAQLALWAADCAEHVLGRFEDVRPDDGRPREAIEAARAWTRGEITVGQSRKAALAAHAAARKAAGSDTVGTDRTAAVAMVAAAVAAARAAGHAAATAHVAAHSRRAALYAVVAVSGAALLAAAADTSPAAVKERVWQRQRLPKHLLVPTSSIE